MNATEYRTLVRLKDTDQTVADLQSDIRGWHVVDKDGEKIGKVEALLIDESEHKVRSFELSSGGFLGLGESKSFIPVETITSIDDHEVHIDRSGKAVAGAPAYDPALIKEPRYLRDAYGYYGIAPYYGIGLLAPFDSDRPIAD